MGGGSADFILVGVRIFWTFSKPDIMHGDMDGQTIKDPQLHAQEIDGAQEISSQKRSRHPNQNCLQWGRSNLVDPAGSPKIRLLNRDFGNILSISPRKNSKKHRVN